MRWKTIIILFVTLFVIGTSLITYLWFQARQAGGVEVVLTAPDSVVIGVPFTAQVAVSNVSSGIVRDTSLTLSLPDGFVFMTEPASKRLSAKSIGSLGEGTVTNQEFRIMPVSGENTLVQLIAGISYTPTNLGSRFEKQSIKEISIGESGISLDLAAPQKVFVGETFEVKVSYENDSDTDFYDLQLLAEYPRGFNFISSTLPPDSENSLWKLGDLRAGSKGSFTLRGTLTGPEGAFFDLAVGVRTSFLGKEYVVNQKTASLSIASSPLALSIEVNDEADLATSKAGDLLSYKLKYRNNTEIGLKDVIVTVKLSGEMFDLPSLSPGNGVLRSSDNSIVWNAARVNEFDVLAPGDSGELRFSIRTYRAYEIRRVSDKNFVVKAVATIESPTVPKGVSAPRTVGSASHEIKVGGNLEVAMLGSRTNAVGIENYGPLPLKVGQPTALTLHWLARSGTTDMGNLVFKTFLGPNVRYTGVFKATNGVAPTYNERTQEFIWSPGLVPATTGYLSDPLELVFQVEVTPSSNDSGEYPELTNETTVTATDQFISNAIFDKLQSFETSLIRDAHLGSGSFRVE